MNRLHSFPGIFYLPLILLVFTQCSKDKSPVNINLTNQPALVVQAYVKGKWRLQYTDGGLWYHKVAARNNAYLVLDSENYIIGDDSAGILLHAKVLWKEIIWSPAVRATAFSYSIYPAGEGPYFLVNEIKNDTLVISNYASDAFYFHYTRF